MHVVVTGAAGFVGRALTRRLLADGLPDGAGADAAPPASCGPIRRLTLIDQRFDDALRAQAGRDARLRLLEGDFGDPRLLAEAFGLPPGLVFHLASVPGSLAEREPALGLRANLLGPIALLQRLANTPRAPAAGVPRVVFASSVAVYGDLPAGGSVDETQALRPRLSYGAHKRMTEILLADEVRRGRLAGVSLRLPGIVARPRSPTGHGSAFMSDLIHAAAAGEAYRCPVSAAASAWWMSLPCCVDNLLHAATAMQGVAGADLDARPALSPDAVVQLPVLTASVAAVAEAAHRLHDAARGPGTVAPAARLEWAPDEAIERLFGRMPRLLTPTARALGFRDDGTLEALVARALAAPG